MSAGVTAVIYLLIPSGTSRIMDLLMVFTVWFCAVLLILGTEGLIERIRYKIRKKKIRDAWKVRPDLADIRIVK